MWSWLADSLADIYFLCFVFGLGFSLLSLFARFRIGRLHLPVGHGHGHHGGIHLGLAGHHGGHAPTAAAHGQGERPGLGDPSPLNLSSLTIFLLWFGAAGYILHVYYGALAGLSLAAATIAGWIGATLIYLLMSRVLWRGQTALDPENYRIAGAVGRVTSTIRAGGTGEIVYTIDGKRRVDGARSIDGAPLANGTEVAIVRYQGGLAYVCPLTWADTDEPPA